MERVPRVLRVGEQGAGREKRGGRRMEKEKGEKERKGEKGGKEKGRGAPAGFTATVASRAWRRREAERTPNEENRKIRR